MATTDWLPIVIAGAGAVMGTLGKRGIRALGIALIVVGLLGAAYSQFHVSADAQGNGPTTNGSGNSVITVPGNNNTVTVTPQNPQQPFETKVFKAKPEDCPRGYTIIYESTARGPFTAGISMPEGARVCIIGGEFRGDLGVGIEVRDPKQPPAK
jgi:hypothetical protein